MSNYGFFKGCLDVCKKKFEEMINSQKTRSTTLDKEVREILQKLEIAYKYNKITEEEYRELLKEFKSIDFTKIAQIRAAIKDAEKMKQRSKYWQY